MLKAKGGGEFGSPPRGTKIWEYLLKDFIKNDTMSKAAGDENSKPCLCSKPETLCQVCACAHTEFS